jgi:hypothetical protein
VLFQSPHTNDERIVLFQSPHTNDERIDVATTCIARLAVKIPALLDGIDNRIELHRLARPLVHHRDRWPRLLQERAGSIRILDERTRDAPQAASALVAR